MTGTGTRGDRLNGLARGAAACAAAVVLFAGPAAASAAGIDLTRGASTVVPHAMNQGIKDAFGRPYVVRSRVTAVRFHQGTLPSTAPGGLTKTPHPQLKTRHGVSFYEVTGELSGIGHSPLGFEYVYGPYDAKRVDQSRNRSSPRYGLRGIAFRLVYPKHWNGRLIVFRPGGDGGRGTGHYLFQSITDELALVRAGYAYFVTLGGTTTPFDSDPDSVSGLFWKLAPPFWAESGDPHPDFLRAAEISSDWSERKIPDSRPGTIWFIGEPEPISTPIGSRAFASDILMTINDDVPTLRDHVVVAKNLLRDLTGSRPSTTGLLAWSRSGALAAGMDLGRTFQASGSVVASARLDLVNFQSLTPRTGGDYTTPYVPGSGRLVDWFVVRSGLEGATAPLPPDGHPDFFDMLPDPDYPVAAPFVFVVGEADLHEVQLNGYYLANALAAALPRSKLAHKNVNHWFRLYTLRGATHYPREAWFAGPYDGGRKTWYEFGGAGYNHRGLGLELPAWIDSLRANNRDLLGNGAFGLDWMGFYDAGLLSEEGFELEAILNADRWARTGAAPPISVADGHLVRAPSGDTIRPRYPVAEACTPDDLLVALDAGCLVTLHGDSVINDPNSGFGPLDPDFEVPLLQRFASGPLRFTTQPIDLPGQAVPLGYRLLTPGPAFREPFTTRELRSRYGTHAGYVRAVKRAVAELVARGLYAPTIGAMDVSAAKRSPVLR